MKFGLVFQIGAWWVGAHYSDANKRLCINIVPCFTFWIASKNGIVPYKKSIVSF